MKRIETAPANIMFAISSFTEGPRDVPKDTPSGRSICRCKAISARGFRGCSSFFNSAVRVWLTFLLLRKTPLGVDRIRASVSADSGRVSPVAVGTRNAPRSARLSRSDSRKRMRTGISRPSSLYLGSELPRKA
jgi:hypothetical protein